MAYFIQKKSLKVVCTLNGIDIFQHLGFKKTDMLIILIPLPRICDGYPACNRK